MDKRVQVSRWSAVQRNRIENYLSKSRRCDGLGFRGTVRHQVFCEQLEFIRLGLVGEWALPDEWFHPNLNTAVCVCPGDFLCSPKTSDRLKRDV